ncbi:MAG TPA: response regulator [Terracidiphilus sp.]
MGSISRVTILFVDDDPCMREVMALILSEQGFEISTACDGIDALVRLRHLLPDLIISDLHMPRMSGFEFLSVVRRRFPTVPVIAISGAYDLSQSSAGGAMADAFYPKGCCHPTALFRAIDQLMYEPLKRPTNYHPCRPPRIQVARNGRDSAGMSVLALNCTECLRAFSVANVSGLGEDLFQAHCPSCGTHVQFTCEAVATAPVEAVIAAAQMRLQVG